MLQRFDGIVRPIVRAYEGRVVKTIGDAFLLTFRSPTNALLCSMAVHDRIAETDREIAPVDRFTVRAAVNAGDVRIEGGDVFGEAVNIAARIEGKAAVGEIWFSEAVYLSMTRSEVPSEEVGLVELKGISSKVRLYRIPRTAGIESGATLPFAGRGLNRVRDRMGASISVLAIAPAVSGVFKRASGLMNRLVESAHRSFEWWRSEVRRSRAVQYGTMIVITLIIVLITWHFTHRQPATPLQRLQQSLGF
jgi:hypothetical protein